MAQSRQDLDSRQEGAVRHSEMVCMGTLLRLKLTYLPVDTDAAHPGPQLVSINQTEFTIEGQPTRHGRIRQTRDMMEVTACICGTPVESELRNSNTAVQCGYRGCETLWVSVFSPSAPTPQFLLNGPQFHLGCLNFEVPPRNWRCPNHIQPTKRQRC